MNRTEFLARLPARPSDPDGHQAFDSALHGELDAVRAILVTDLVES